MAVWFLSILILLPIIGETSSEYRSHRVRRSEEDINLVIKFSPLAAFCVMSENETYLSPTVLPLNATEGVTTTGSYYNEVRLREAIHVRAVICPTAAKPVIGPIIHTQQATLISGRRKFTVNKDESLRLPLRPGSHLEYSEVLWRRISVEMTAWTKATISEDDKVLIPANTLQESGVYSIIPNFKYDTDEHGLFEVVVRDCPAERYGSNCQEWCPDCLHGGLCDSRSGECLCPPGVIGNRCQTKCQTGFIGRNCSMPLTRNPIGWMVCVSLPFGCSCGPGYQGENCFSRCPPGKWGVDCEQTCNECSKKGCFGWGKCRGRTPIKRNCNEGDLGLPHLRHPPNITSVKSQSVVVSFTQWKFEQDDGELPSNNTIISYQLVTWRENETDSAVKQKVSPPLAEVSDLEPGTTYHVKVLVEVEVDGERCTTDDTGRGRIHVVTFNTTCEDLPKLEGDVNVKLDSNSLSVKWKKLRYVESCNFHYKLEITNPSGKDRRTFWITDSHIKLDDLDADTEYAISLQVCKEDKKDCSRAINTSKRTYKDLVVASKIQGGEALFTWGLDDTFGEKLEFRTYSEVISVGELKKNISSSWTDWSYDTSLKVPIVPYSIIKVRIFTRNERGDTGFWETALEVPPSEPGRVKDMHVVLYATSVEVKWNKPDDILPLGELEAFRVTWNVVGQPSTINHIMVSKDMRSYTIKDLHANTEYNIKVEAKNKNVTKYGVAFNANVTTKGVLALNATKLNVTSTNSSLLFGWNQPENISIKATGYDVFLYNDSNESFAQKVSVNNTFAEFKGLCAGCRYIVVVLACNNQTCINMTKQSFWTIPSKPRLQGTLSLVTSNYSSITLLLPLLANPPGWYLLMVQKEDHNLSTQAWKAQVNATAMTLAENYYQSNVTNISDSSMYIAKEIRQDGHDRLMVTLGDNTTYAATHGGHSHNTLEKNAAYWVAVVAEKRAGSRVKRTTIDPQRFIAAPFVQKIDHEYWYTSSNFIIILSVIAIIILLTLIMVSVHIYRFCLRSKLTVWWSKSTNNGTATFSRMQLGISKMATSTTDTVELMSGKLDTSLSLRCRANLNHLDNSASLSSHENYYELEPRQQINAESLYCDLDHNYLEPLHLDNSASLSSHENHYEIPCQPNSAASLYCDIENNYLEPYHPNNSSSFSCNTNYYELEPYSAVPCSPVTAVSLPITPHSCIPTVAFNICFNKIFTLEINRKDLEEYLLKAITTSTSRIEFEEVDCFISPNCFESHLSENCCKNRYKNKACYDRTRVILPCHGDISTFDYINANYIMGASQTISFIAAETPMKETVGAFWRMMWHTNCCSIITLSNLTQKTEVEMTKYWPEVNPCTIDGVTITPTTVTVRMGFVIRTFIISVNNTSREIKQYHYTSWPDHCVPNTPYLMANMIKEIRSCHDHQRTTSVHCSDGMGRTGTMILVMHLLEQLETHGTINIKKALSILRQCRGGLVENIDQYIFAHQLFYEVVFGVKTSFTCQSFEEEMSQLHSSNHLEISSKLQQQYEKLKSYPQVLTFQHGKDPACIRFNRNQDILPADNRIVFLQGMGSSIASRYVNVIRIIGIDQQDACLVGEHPQWNTLTRIWQLVFELKIKVWILIHNFPNIDAFPDVVNASSECLGNIYVEVVSTETFQYYEEQRVQITVTESGNVMKHSCTLIRLGGWPSGDCLPPKSDHLFDIIEKLYYFSSCHQPPLITCKDGVTGCGVLAALMLAVFRYKMIQEVDIYCSVASVLQDRSQFIVNIEQYIFLHTFMIAFIKRMKKDKEPSIDC